MHYQAAARAARRVPWSLFAPHRHRPFAFFLDHGKDDAPSFAGSQPAAQLVVDHEGRSRCWNGSAWRFIDTHPVDAIEEFVERNAAIPLELPDGISPEEPLPRTVGYLAYELGSWIEEVPVAGSSLAALPLALLSTYDRVHVWSPRFGRAAEIRFSNRAGKGWKAPPHGSDSLRAAKRARVAALALDSRAAPEGSISFDHYRRGFQRIMEAIASGEIYQANLSRPIALRLTDDPLAVYLHMRRCQPVPHGAYLDTGCTQILSNSPECFLKIRGDRISTFPIKGTRPTRALARQNHKACEELLSDPKERAEHVMIVDLERNDLGRICETGSVVVPTLAALKSFATVHHLVSEVRGRLRSSCGLSSILRATFPGGSITGAPKIKAMEIIAEVEQHARGIYTGAIGSFNGSRSVALNIAIRTAVAAGGWIYYHSGGAIVADSTLEGEYAETNTKARAFLEAMRARPEQQRAVVS